MDVRRLRIDPFSFALAVLTMITLAFFAARNGAAVIMCALCLAGVLAARLAGFPDRALVPLVFGLAVILWVVWVDPPAGPRKTSALAHFAGGALAGWALAETLRRRFAWRRWIWGALAGVLVLTMLWELGEWLADRAFETGLQPSKRDSVLDIVLGMLGSSVAIGLAWVVAQRAESRSNARSSGPNRARRAGRGSSGRSG